MNNEKVTGDKPYQGRNKTVLVADDEEILLLFAESVLNDDGFNVVTANDWSSALEKLRRNPESISVAILDWTMPGGNGNQALQSIHEISPHLPVIICTSHPPDILNDRNEHPYYFLPKTYSPHELIQTVKTGIESRMHPDELV